jgi:ribosomal protein S18 acetylase RimI-like enzyme
MSFSDTLLSRVEDAGLNASAPPQQRWLDGWIVRTHPGKARRARCINAMAAGRLPLAEKLRLAQAMFDEANLPLVMRITRFTQPDTLDDELAAAGWPLLVNTHVWVCAELPAPTMPAASLAPPAGLAWQRLDAGAYASAVGALRGSPSDQQTAHAERLRQSPVPYQGHALLRSDGQVVACGQFAREGELVGLYDVFTHPSARGQGLAGLLCERLLSLAAAEGAKLGYLQVEADNDAALAVYRRLGFAHGYSYHYRQPPGSA